MDFTTGHVLTIFLMLISCFLACFLPSIVHFHADVNSRKQRILNALKRYCNCISGGVFAGAFFTQFYPHVTKEFAALLPAENSIWNHPLQLGPSVVFVGFVLTALVERGVDLVLERFKRKKSQTGSSIGAQEMRQVDINEAGRAGVPLIVYEDDEENSIDTDPLTLPKNDKLILPDPAKSIRDIHRNGAPSHSHSHSHSTSGHHDHTHHHHSHHHFAFDDYQGLTRFIVLFASLGTHSIFEGLALGLLSNVSLLWNMFISILVHEVLMAFALGISLSQQKMKLWLKCIFSLSFAAIIPIGQGVGLLIQTAPSSSGATIVISLLQLLAAGTFLHVMFMEILPQEMHGHFGLVEAFFVMLGYVMIPVTSLLTGGGDHH